MHTLWSRVAVVSFTAALAACGGGGGGGGGDSSSPPSQAAAPAAPQASTVRVSGTVSIVAATAQTRGWSDRLLALLVPPAAAGVGGLSPARAGSQVQLARINAVGAVTEVLASGSTDANGRYSLEASAVGLTRSSDMIVIATSPASGITLRAFAYGENVDVSPESEAVAGIVLAQIRSTANATLANLTTNEARNLADAADMITSVFRVNVTASQTTTSLVTALQTRFEQSGLNAMAASAIAAGDSPAGPGDFARFFPAVNGQQWDYNVTGTGAYAGAAPSMSRTVTGTSVNAAGATAVVLRETSSGVAVNRSFEVANNSVAQTQVDSGGGGLLSFLSRYDRLRLPMRLNVPYAVTPQNGISFPDTDRDGRPESADYRGTLTLIEHGTYTGPGAPTAVAAITVRLDAVITLRPTQSPPQTPITLTITDTSKFAAGVGLVSEVGAIVASSGTASQSGSITFTLRAVTTP